MEGIPRITIDFVVRGLFSLNSQEILPQQVLKTHATLVAHRYAPGWVLFIISIKVIVMTKYKLIVNPISNISGYKMPAAEQQHDNAYR